MGPADIAHLRLDVNLLTDLDRACSDKRNKKDGKNFIFYERVCFLCMFSMYVFYVCLRLNLYNLNYKPYIIIDVIFSLWFFNLL
jgi:hypothetical protein